MIGVKDHQYKISEKNIERFGHCVKKIDFFVARKKAGAERVGFLVYGCIDS